jgi:hypothetical protein
MTYPSGENPKLDLLSFAFGTEFNECSIAAAELNKQVYSELDGGKTQQRVLYQIGDDPTLGQRFVAKDLNYESKTGGDIFHLALVRPTSSLRGRSAVLRRAIEKSVDIFGSEPQLVAILGNEDVFVPLATFARREGGTCSYVQLGSEMNDDSLFVTTADEGTSRQDVIEKIRQIVASAKDIPTKPPLISSLLAGELAGKEAQLLDKAKEAMMVRRIYERAKPKEQSRFRVLDESTGEFIQHNTNTHGLFHGLKMEDGRVVNLMLAEGLGNNLQLLATTRGDIALPLASFDKLEGTVDLLGLEDKLSVEQRRDIVGTLHHIICMNFEPRSLYWTHSYNKQRDDVIEKHRTDLVIAQYLNERGLLNLSEIWHTRSERLKIKDIDEKEIHRKIDDFLVNPASPKPFSPSEPLDLFVAAKEKHNQGGVHTCTILNVASRLEMAIGACSSNEELLFGKVWSMANKAGVFSAVANNVQLGKTRGDAKVNAEVQRDGTVYSVIISGSPLAMPDEKPRPILRLDFDSTQPLIDRKNQTDPSLRAKDILNILNLF